MWIVPMYNTHTHESCKNNPICWARTGGAAGRAAPPGLCNQVSGNADFGTGMDARVQGCTGAAAAKDMARRMHVQRACLEKRQPGGKAVRMKGMR